jgi:hypothetical protein
MRAARWRGRQGPRSATSSRADSGLSGGLRRAKVFLVPIDEHAPAGARGIATGPPGGIPVPRYLVRAIFKAEAFRGGPPYQVAIHQALRRYLHQPEKDVEAEAVEAVLAALDDPSVRRKIRSLSRAPSGAARSRDGISCRQASPMPPS